MSEVLRNDSDAAVRHLARSMDTYVRDARTGTEAVEFARQRLDRQLTLETSARRNRMERAQRDYDRCLAGEGDCSRELHVLERATAAFEAAQQARRRFDSAAREYGSAARRFGQVVDVLTTEIKRILGRIALDLEQYDRTTRLLGGAAVQSAASGDGAVALPATGNNLEPHVPPGFPTGFAMVPLAAINSGDILGTPPRFKMDVAAADLEWAFEAFGRVIVPALAMGKGPDYFRDRDQREHLCGTRSYTDTYRGFLTDDEAPRFARRVDGTYAVENGYHRLWVARRLGLTTIAGRVVGP